MADLQMYADHFLMEFINEAVLGVAYEAHRSFTRGTLFLDENASDEEENKYKIVIANGLDIFGQPIGGSKKNVECVCPNCNRNMAASRFAPHLEKCMGMGRNSSRIASQRIANSGKLASAVNDGLGVDDDVDDANDADWIVACESSSSRKAKKRKGDRNNGMPRNAKSVPSKLKNSPKSIASSSSSQHRSTTPEQYVTDLNANVSSASYASRESSSALNENVNHTVTLWEKHINATLSGQSPSKNMVSSNAKVPANTGVVKKSKKSSKHSHNKKNKKRQVPSQSSTVL